MNKHLSLYNYPRLPSGFPLALRSGGLGVRLGLGGDALPTITMLCRLTCRQKHRKERQN